MILSALIVAICIAAILQPTCSRTIAAICFAAFTLLHDWLLGDADGFAYYGSAALADLIIVALLYKLEPLPKMALSLQKLCVVSIVTNFAGYLLWYSYAPPAAYNAAFLVVFAWAVWIMTRDLRNVGNPADDRGGLGIRYDTGPRPFLLSLIKGSPRC